MKTYYVYMLTNKYNTVLYTGFTDDLVRRVSDHKRKINPHSFTSKYNCNKLIYFEEYENIDDAFNREKQLKKYKRVWKENLINENNFNWDDLSKEWYD
ncbi:MAG: GIY-YIG nuclease family protein [Flavobacteriales bacterium]|nr:GIY-YIG nuclease family protein [Flavobacteriales bacterium]